MISNLKIKTADKESVCINEVDFIGLGNMGDVRDPCSKREELCIRSPRGMITFPLSKIKSIEFIINNDEHIVSVISNYEKQKEGL